jgi:Flp pilus assembly protein TadD
MESGDFEAAVAAFETALKLEPRMVPVMVNLSMACSNLKQNDKAEAWLRRALKAEPDNAAANFNLGLLLAETSRPDEAEKALRAALKSDPQLAPAAYNLAVILGEKKDLAGAVQWSRKARDLRPEELKYTETLVFYLNASGNRKAAARVLRDAMQQPGFPPQLREAWQAQAEELEK